jgi:hypothetical protein
MRDLPCQVNIQKMGLFSLPLNAFLAQQTGRSDMGIGVFRRRSWIARPSVAETKNII